MESSTVGTLREDVHYETKEYEDIAEMWLKGKNKVPLKVRELLDLMHEN